nr:carboxypeptidase-like regulatory domain-containing protein [Pseudoalteromonas caenipelagi]
MLANRKTDIELDEQSINDPFLVPRNSGISITPRAGYVEYVDFPLVNASEVEGTIYAQRGKVLPYAKVNLLDEDGKLVAQTESAFDGYYLFTGLKPGQYVAQVDEAQLQQKNLKATQTVMVELPNEGSVLSGVDLSLLEMDKFNGVFSSLGEFSSLSILKTYFVLINKRLKNLPGYNPFYFTDSNSGKYILAVSYSVQPSKEVNKMCEWVAQRGLSCEVKQTLIKY